MQIFIGTTEEQTAYINIAGTGTTMYLHLYPFQGMMYCDISNDDGYVVSGKRVIQNQWLLPLYANEVWGNFRFETYDADHEEYVWYDGFNKKFRLMAYTPEDFETGVVS